MTYDRPYHPDQARPGALRRTRAVATSCLAAGVALLGTTLALPAGAVAPGVVQAFGSNTRGQLGNGLTTQATPPPPNLPDYFPVPGPVLEAGPLGSTDLALVAAISGGNAHSLALKTNNTVRSWGANDDGQLGNCSTTDSSLAVTVGQGTGCATFNNISDVDGGGRHSLAVKNNDTVWAWGHNAAGELGDATTTSRSYAVQVKTDSAGTTNLTGISAVSAGSPTETGDHSLGLKSDGTVWAWGENSNGQLGDLTNTNRSYAAKVKTAGATCGGASADLTGITEIAAGAGHSLGLKSDGTVWAWGNNANGELGDGTTTDRTCAVQVLTAAATGLTGVTHVSAGWHHSVAVKSDGTVVAWGDNQYAQLGQGIASVPTDSSYALAVKQFPDAIPTNLTGVSKISAGGQHTLVVKATDGTVWCWGRSDHGECGAAAGDMFGVPPGVLFFQSTAIAVVGAVGGPPATAAAVAGGGGHSLVM